MIKIVKRLATLLLALGFISITCAATIPPKAMPLGGTPRVETIGITIGMSVVDLDRELGTPHGTDTCYLPFEIKGEMIMAHGRSFMWEYIFTSIPKEIDNDTIIMVCVIDDTVVAERREWMFIKGDLEQRGQSETLDSVLLQEVMDNLLRTNPSQYPIEHRHRGKGFVI